MLTESNHNKEAARPGIPDAGPQLPARKTVGICETQPVTVEGLRAVLTVCGNLALFHAANVLAAARQMMQSGAPDVLILDKAFGIQAVVDVLQEVKSAGCRTGVVVWGSSISESEALRFLQSGARGIIRKTAPLERLQSCLKAVAAGASWVEETVFRESPYAQRYPTSQLTPRELQVMELVEQGMKNKEIAAELGIRPGTVKIHLKHIFEKTGIRGRYGLALNWMRDQGRLTPAEQRQTRPAAQTAETSGTPEPGPLDE